MDAAEQFVTDVHAELTALGVPITGKFGGKKALEHSDAPLVNWWLGPIDFAQVESSQGMEATAIYVDVQTLNIRIWHTTNENVRAALHNVIAAARSVGYGFNIAPGRFTWSETASPQHLKRFASVTGTIGLKLPVLAEPIGLVTIESVQHNAYANGELQTTDNSSTPLP